MLIGLTGLIGSGKSEVAAVWKQMGARIVSADAIGREVVEKNHEVLYRLLIEFGPGIMKNDKLDRRLLGRLAFFSPEKTLLLNRIVHPELLKQLDKRIRDAANRKKSTIIDAALLINWGYHRKMDCTVMVSSTRQNRFRRLRRSGLTDQEIKQRTRSQLTETELRRAVEYIITNNKDLASLQRRARILYSQLTERG